jgi:hypothetical protein
MINRIYKYYSDFEGLRISGFKNLILQTVSSVSLLLKIFIILLPFYSCGGEFETLFDDTVHFPEFIYWTEGSGTINRVNIDTLEKSLIYNTGTTPLDIDVYDDKVYWAEYTGGEYRIGRVSIDGTGDEIIYTPDSLSRYGPASIAIDRSEGLIFFNERRSPSAGAAESAWKWNMRRSAISASLVPVDWIEEITIDYIYSIHINPGNSNIYFTANSYYDSVHSSGSGNTGSAFTGSLLSAGTAVNRLASDLSGLSSPSTPVKGIAAGGSGYVYYVTNTASGKNIRRADFSFNNDIIWIDENVLDIGKIALDYGRRKIYWTSASDNKIYRADMDMPNYNVEIFVDLSGTPTGIALD